MRTRKRGGCELGKPALLSMAPQFGHLDLVGAQDQRLGDTPQLLSSALQLVPGERALVGPEAL